MLLYSHPNDSGMKKKQTLQIFFRNVCFPFFFIFDMNEMTRCVILGYYPQKKKLLVFFQLVCLDDKLHASGHSVRNSAVVLIGNLIGCQCF